VSNNLAHFLFRAKSGILLPFSFAQPKANLPCIIMNRRQEKEAQEWAKSQTKSLSIDIPDREPGEEPITKKQIEYIRHLAKSIDMNEIEGLGKWQASSLIEQLKAAQEDFTQEALHTAKKKFGGGCLVLATLPFAFLLTLFALLIGTLR
jgi:hypothetical protein